jgi:hypothetical protein
MMNILFLTQILPYPPDAGPKVKTWHVIRALIGQGHSVTLVSFVRPEEEQHIPALKKVCAAVHVVPIRRSRFADVRYMLRSYLTTRPFLVERDDLGSMQAMVNKLVQECDFHFIHADQLTMVQFALRGASAFPVAAPAARRRSGAPPLPASRAGGGDGSFDTDDGVQLEQGKRRRWIVEIDLSLSKVFFERLGKSIYIDLESKA